MMRRDPTGAVTIALALILASIAGSAVLFGNSMGWIDLRVMIGNPCGGEAC